jgi:type IV pilus assembly protein PilY1
MQRRKTHPETRDRRSGAAHARVLAKRALVGGFVGAVLLAPARSRAQSDVAPPLPNVLILLDTSGSMERFPNGKLPTVTSMATSNEKTRWVQALEVLGGSIDNFALLHQPRTGADFTNEYGLGGQSPYDIDYFLPHYRALSNNCAIGSSSLSTTKTWPADWTTWGTSSFGFRQWSGASLGTIGSCGATDYKTDGLGILDTFRDQARFGLMTFDTTQNPKTGWNGTSHDAVAGMTGAWSYFPGWDGSGTYSPTYGWPAGCSLVDSPLANHVQELGARNPSAPPWEGPMVPFATDDSTTALRGVNDRIRYAMLAARPYGATPIAPMLADAQYYLWGDPKGPKIDPLGTCRGNFVILITDGFPTSDLRPNCENSADPKSAATWPSCDTSTGGGGCCPTKRAQDIAYDLAHPPLGKPAIKTFVVGFGLSDDTGAPVDCSIVDPSSGACSAGTLDPKYKPCCTLHEIAYNGDTASPSKGRALLANDVDTLRSALLAAMSEATASTSTSRTIPVFSMASSGTTAGGQYEFRSSFKVNAFSSWSGILERVRWECKSTSGTLRAEPVLPIVAASGDDFAVNLNKQPTRTFVTWDATSVGSGVKAGDTLRPNLASADSDGILPASPTKLEASNATFVSSLPAANLQLTTTSCSDAASIDECKAKFLNYALALPQPKPTWMSRVGNALGDIYHATPVQVGPPSGFLRDESYTTFRNTEAKRTPVMLAATNDGLLHAFKTTVTSDTDPVELWGFIPPAVLPHIAKQYGGAHALLLDASPVVKDVAFGQPTSTTAYGRTRSDARGGTARWRTVAVGALTTGRGYYAVDITDVKTPQLLWQITKYKDSAPTSGGSSTEYDLFGTYPGTPAIGTIYYSESAGGTPVETPVAFLPGGESTQFAPGVCNRWVLPTDGVTRKQVRCWTGAGNTFTIVRLWDGKVLRSFRNDPTGDATHPPEPNSATARWAATKATIVTDTSTKYAGIDSPITGTVALYPAAEGSVTTRAFVGDYDGTLWKLDISDSNPQKWTFDIFHDAYHTGDAANAVSSAWGPVAIAPVLTVDRFGDIVVDYATGDQNNFSTSNLNHVYSITERTTVTSSGKSLVPKLNWHLKFSGGVTPTGPMSLFSGNLFFSTFTPDIASGDACLKGQGTLWGVDYLETEPSIVNDDGTPVPMGRHTKSPTATTDESSGTCPPSYANADSRGTGYPFFRCIKLPAGSIVFGAGITQRPSCVSTPSSAIGIDPYMGGTSSHMTISDISVGEFQLVAQTGPKSGTTTGSGSTTNTYVRSLVPPLSSTRIDSWAAIIE